MKWGPVGEGVKFTALMQAGCSARRLQNEIIYSQVCFTTVFGPILSVLLVCSLSLPPPRCEVTVPSCTIQIYLNEAGPKQHQRKLYLEQSYRFCRYFFVCKLLMFSSGVFVINIVGFSNVRSHLLLLKHDEAALRIKHRSHKQPETGIIFRPPKSLKFHRSDFVCCRNWDSGVKTWYIFDFLHL